MPAVTAADSLAARIKAAPLWRSHSTPFGTRRLVVVCFQRDMAHLGAVITPQNVAHIERIVLFDHSPTLPRTAQLAFEAGKAIDVPVSDVRALQDCLHCELIFFHHTYDYYALAEGQAALMAMGFPSYHLCMPYLYNEGHQTRHDQAYYATHRHGLDAVDAMLADEESRLVLAARIRALLTGNVGYLRMAAYPQYFHPEVQPAPGDVVIDGGVSAVVAEQRGILEAVGDSGMVVGFEPDPEGFAKASTQIAAFDAHSVYTLMPFGLWHAKEQVTFAPAGVGSHVTGTPSSQGISVAMTSIDMVVQERNLPRVDYIKLDVEGSEHNALRGAVQTIAAHKPKLGISLYHKPEDLYSLPQYIKELAPEYTFYLGHHHPTLFETVLYATTTPPA